MDRLQGRTATWHLDHEKVVIHYRTPALLKVLSRLEVPVAAIAAVEFAAEGKKGWRLARL
jgi:hypothetical protein